MKFSICIPNYNYARYIGETIESVLHQDAELEVILADNASTDDSVAVIEAFDDPRIKLWKNRWNVGFANNLDRACRSATGDRMILLSSDDLAKKTALKTYQELAEALGDDASHMVFASAQHMIDSDGECTGVMGTDARLWADAREDQELTERLGVRILRCDARRLLRRSLRSMRTPFHFATTCYSRELYERVEGYGGGPLMNPDKYFAWRLLAVAREAIFVDAPLFVYRVHDSNQSALQRQSGALKHLMDQYRATFDLDPRILEAADMTKDDLAHHFVEEDIALRGLKMVAEGDRKLARRGLDFGKAAYPGIVAKSNKVKALRTLLSIGPAGTAIARRLIDRAMKSYRRGGFVETRDSSDA